MRRIVVLLSLVLASGCRWTDQDTSYEGYLFVHTAASSAHRADSRVKVGPDYDHMAANRISSSEFWTIFYQLNAEYAELSRVNLQSRVNLWEPTVFRFEGRHYVRWKVQIKNGDEEIFDAICATYLRIDQDKEGVVERLEFLQERLDSFQAELSKRDHEYDQTGGVELADNVRVLKTNIANLESQIQRARNRMSDRPGSLALHLMPPRFQGRN